MNLGRARTASAAVVLCTLLLVLLHHRSSFRYRTGDSANPTLTEPSLVNGYYVATDDKDVDVVVARRSSENTSWLYEYFPEWHKQIYTVDDAAAALSIPKNKGRESMVYLTYMIDNYDHLPSHVLFIHAGRWQWHNDNPDYDGYDTLSKLQLRYVREEGYVNLRCTWVLGCPSEIRPFEDVTNPDEKKPTARAYKKAFEELFPGELVPDVVGVSCCAQFAATRERIQQRPKEDYAKFREWLLNTELDDSTSGRVFEYSWHMIFGKQPVHCPRAKDCYCKLFSLCDLQCNSDDCRGQYVLPKYSNLPEGWPWIGWDEELRNFTGPL